MILIKAPEYIEQLAGKERIPLHMLNYRHTLFHNGHWAEPLKKEDFAEFKKALLAITPVLVDKNKKLSKEEIQEIKEMASEKL